MKRRKLNTEIKLCCCGCGKPVNKNRKGRYNQFLLGHNPKHTQNKTDENCCQQPSYNGNSGQFRPGNKVGKGRPEGSKNKVTLAAENIFENEAGTIARKAVDMALDGNPGMIKLILERIVPVRRSVPVKLPGMPKAETIEDIAKLTNFILAAIAEGTVSPADAEIISRAIDRHLKALHTVELGARFEEALDIIDAQGK